MDLGYLQRLFGMPFEHDPQVNRETKGNKIDLGKVVCEGLFGFLVNGTSVNGFGDCYRLSSAGRHRNGCRVRYRIAVRRSISPSSPNKIKTNQLVHRVAPRTSGCVPESLWTPPSLISPSSPF